MAYLYISHIPDEGRTHWNIIHEYSSSTKDSVWNMKFWPSLGDWLRTVVQEQTASSVVFVLYDVWRIYCLETLQVLAPLNQLVRTTWDAVLLCTLGWERGPESLHIVMTWKLVSNGPLGLLLILFFFLSAGCGVVLWLLLLRTANWTSQHTGNGNINFTCTKLEIPFHLSAPITFNLNERSVIIFSRVTNTFTYAYQVDTCALCIHRRPNQYTSSLIECSPLTAFSAIKCRLTCAFFDARSFLHSMPAKLALEVILPELCKPDIPSVVL